MINSFYVKHQKLFLIAFKAMVLAFIILFVFGLPPLLNYIAIYDGHLNLLKASCSFEIKHLHAIGESCIILMNSKFQVIDFVNRALAYILPNCRTLLCDEITGYVSFLISIVLLVLTVKFILRKSILTFFGFNKFNFKKAFLKTWLAALVVFIFLNALSLFSHPVPLNQQLNISPYNPYLLIRSMLFYPIIEEILFRGFLYQFLKNCFSRMLSNNLIVTIFSGVLQALVWVLFHGQFHSVIVLFDVFVLGCFLAYVREKTNSIFPAMIYHGAFNGVSVTLTAILAIIN